MPQAIITPHKSSPIFKDVIRLKHTRAPIVNYAHARAVCTRLFFSMCCPCKEPEDEANSAVDGLHAKTSS